MLSRTSCTGGETSSSSLMVGVVGAGAGAATKIHGLVFVVRGNLGGLCLLGLLLLGD